jgi:hypothetical protein
VLTTTHLSGMFYSVLDGAHDVGTQNLLTLGAGRVTYLLLFEGHSDLDLTLIYYTSMRNNTTPHNIVLEVCDEHEA